MPVTRFPGSEEGPLAGVNIRRLMSFLARRMHQPDHAEECLAEALARVHGRYGEQEGSSNLDALIVRTALNVEIDDFRRKQLWGDVADIAECGDVPDGTPLQDEILVVRQRLDRVRAGLAELPPRTRQAILLRRVEGLSYRDIAGMMAISESAVEKHVARGLRFLSAWAAGW